MNKPSKMRHYINCLLSTVGIIVSFYVLGWVDHENHTIIGTICFLLFLFLLVGGVINYNVSSNRTDKD